VKATGQIPIHLIVPVMKQKPIVAAESIGAAGPANLGIREKALKGEVFIRFSAYENDRRVTANRGLEPGTYATTLADAEVCIEKGEDPIARYALPSLESPKYAFRITPPDKTAIQGGTVEPANGQPGGGAETIFPEGTPANTVSYAKDVSDGVLP
jgi:hypothetical protein